MKRVVVECSKSAGIRVQEGAVAMLEDCTVRENHPDYETVGGRIEGIDQSLIKSRPI
eukprot:COSAG06_NODE_2728_length_6381_cov_2.712034_8_plen_57_part_00